MAAMLELPKGKQRRSILQANARLNIWHGSVSSGKTVGSIIRWLDFVANAPQGELLMVGKTERSLKRNILDVIETWTGGDYKLVQGSGECWIFGRRIYLAGANDERSEGKIRGLTLAGAYGDELTLWPESFFTTLLARLRVAGAKFFGTTNPDSQYHWLMERYLKDERASELDLKQWGLALDDNPNLDPAYVASLKKEFTGLWHKRFIQGLWVMAEGAIYDMFDEAVHVVDTLPDRFDRYLLGGDYATGNPTAFILVGQKREGGVERLYAVDEYYWDSAAKGRQKTDAEYSKDLQAFILGRQPHAICIDPSAASFILQLRRDGVSSVREADNDVLDGIRTVSTFLSDRRLFISRKGCPNLLKEFTNYVWDSRAQKQGEDKPLKQQDHCLDALRYSLFTMLGRPVARAVGGGRKPAGF